MNRVAVIIGLIVFGAAFVWLNAKSDHKIVVSEAKISRMMDGAIMVTAKVANGGEADVLLGAQSQGYEHAHFMGAKGDLVVPGGAAPILAVDGAHIMMSGGDGIEVGELVPVELIFRNTGKVSARAKVIDGMMDHSNMSVIEAPDIHLTLRLDEEARREGVTGIVEIEGLNVVSRPDGTPHVAGEGHAHVYLNGLKLKRLYEGRFDIGNLPSGDYVLRVSVNSNDHRAYAKEGVPIAAELVFSVE